MRHRVLRVLVVLVFVACFLRRMGGPALADEIDFTIPLEPWVASGPHAVGLWHSPLYPWLLSILGKAFVFTPALSRLIGFVCAAVTGLCIYAAARTVRPRLEEWKRTALLALGLLSPIVLGSALVLDYDTTLLAAATSIYLYALVYVGQLQRRGPGIGLCIFPVFGVSLGFCFLGKESTPLIYPVGVLVLLWPFFGPLRAALVTKLSGILGVLIFLGFSWAWCHRYGLPLSKVFEMDLLGLKIHSGHPDAWSKLGLVGSLWVKLVPLFWIGLPLALLFCFRLRSIFRDEPSVRAVASVVLAVLVAYTFGLRQMTYQFPKYMAPVLGWVAWLVIVNDRGVARLSAAWLCGVLAWFLVIPDPMSILYYRDPASALTWLGLTAAPFALWWVLRSRKSTPRLATLAIVVTLGLTATYCREALMSGKSITYWYGERAAQEAKRAVEKWRGQHPNGVIYVPAKDIHFATRGFGAQYWSKEVLQEQREKLCAMARARTVPMLFVTRIREDSSLIRSPRLSAYRACLPSIREGVDIALGSSYPLD